MINQTKTNEEDNHFFNDRLAASFRSDPITKPPSVVMGELAVVVVGGLVAVVLSMIMAYALGLRRLQPLCRSIEKGVSLL